MSSNYKKKYSLLLIISLILISLSIYTYIGNSESIIPECQAIVKINTKNNDVNLNGYYLASVIPNNHSSHQYSYLMNGNINFKGEKINIARKFIFKYSLQSNYIVTQVDKIIIDPSDKVKETIKLYIIPQKEQLYYLRIKRINDKNYIVENNYSPLFICTS